MKQKRIRTHAYRTLHYHSKYFYFHKSFWVESQIKCGSFFEKSDHLLLDEQPLCHSDFHTITMMRNTIALFTCLILCFACDTEISKDQLTQFTKLSAEETGIDFVNTIENQKEMNIFKYRNFYNGGGVAIGDINNDGLADVYLTANQSPNKLYLNKGNFKFEDITVAAGVSGNKPWSTGVVMADINADGYLDIYVSNAGNMEGDNHNNDLYINNGDLTFSERAEEYGLSKTGFTTHSSFFDYDKDGDLDAYILNNSNIPVSSLGYADQRELRANDWDVPKIFSGVGDLLLRNDNGKFVDVSEEAGIYGSLIGFGLGVYVTDLNDDRYPDIYVSNDFYERDYLYINNQDGTFTEDIKNWTSHLCLSAMGVDMGDINNDGLNDIFITDMLPEPDQRVKSVMEFEGYNVFELKRSRDFYQQYIQNTLQLNNGNGSFSEIAYFSGVAATDWSWAGLLFDMDNDGYKDIYVTNGINHDLTDIDFVDFFANEVIQKMALTGKKEEITEIINKMPVVPLSNYAYRNKGDLTFDNVAKDWGLDIPSFSNGCAYADFDNDGDLDFVVNNANMEAFVFRNNAESVSNNNYLKFRFTGSGDNPFAIGAKVVLYTKNGILSQENMPSRGFQSSMEYTLTIGLGALKEVDSVYAIWPDDELLILKSVAANQSISLDLKDADQMFGNSEKVALPLLAELENGKLNTHREDLFNDFDQEGLISHKLSQEGPAMATADIDGDGNEDLFIGGAAGQEGVIYQLKNGQLMQLSQKSMEKDADYEDVAAAFFDADQDGDQDLVVGTGGNSAAARNYDIRLYFNDGQGNFSRSTVSLPKTNMNVSVIAPDDFDGDGDVDLFVGSRSVPGIYGVNPEHLFLVNQGDGTFLNGSERHAYDLKDAGMITDADWFDYDADGDNDLITVSDWGRPVIYENNGRRLSAVTTRLDSLSGWWKTVEVSDLDQDGDLDLVLGNSGNNIPYKAYDDRPVRMWINDFDDNGTIEQVVTRYYDNGDFPIHMRKEMTAQVVSLKKENLKASDYSKRTIHQLFPKEVMTRTIMKEVNFMKSVIAVNEGNGNFSIKELPDRVQLSCICGIVCEDLNDDGYLDLIMAGNDFEFKPQYSRQDASSGNVLLGNETLQYEWLPYRKSGFSIREEVKHLGVLTSKDGRKLIVAAINDERPRVYKLQETPEI